MARPQVADGEDGLQTWKVAADILNKQSRTTDKGVFQVGGRLTTHCKKTAYYEMLHKKDFCKAW
jgi:hypothetical protein